jgi:ABC-type enterochelin transport system permease subunit
MGLLGLLAVILRMRNLGLGQWFIRVSAITMLVLSLVGAVTMVSVGIILFPAAILPILAAIGRGKKAEVVPVGAT